MCTGSRRPCQSPCFAARPQAEISRASNVGVIYSPLRKSKLLHLAYRRVRFVDIWSLLFLEPRIEETVSADGDIGVRLVESLLQHEVRVPVSIDFEGRKLEKPGPKFPASYLTYNWRFGGAITPLGRGKYLLKGILRVPPFLRLTFKFAYAFSALLLVPNVIGMLRHLSGVRSNPNLIAISAHDFYRAIVVELPIAVVVSLICLVGSLASRGQRERIIEAFHALGERELSENPVTG
jgi:hypothetical protein